MAEVLGTVVGVVSLGLQVCTEINTYLDAVQCRKEDLEHTARCCRSMKGLLKQIGSLQNRISATMGVNTATIEEAMSAAKAELSILDEFVREICTGNTSNTSRSAMERIKDQQRRFLYPFRKDHLYRLNDRLETANTALHSALQLVELEVSLNHDQALQGLQANLDSLTQGVSNMHVEMTTSVRQLHSDTTASHSALVRMEKTSDEATSILAMSHRETISCRKDMAEMKKMLAALVSPDDRAVLPMLVSKPEALRKISDVARNGSADDAPDLPARYYSTEKPLNRRAYLDFQCTCKPRRVTKHSKRRIGLAFMEQERVTDNIHAPRCPFACFHTSSNEKYSFGISIKKLEGILHAALTISMSATFGAGGFGISPSFTYFPVREDSPALRVVSLLEDAFQKRVWSDEEADHLFQRGIKTLQVTMTAKKWSPFDVDGRGRSLLEAINHGVPSTWQGNQIKTLTFFLSLGVPRDRPDDYGTFPFHSYLQSGYYQEYYAEAFDLLWPDELVTIPSMMYDTGVQSKVVQPRYQDYPNVERMEYHKIAATLSSKMTKLYEGHLMQAIVRKSKPMLFDIINEDLITSQLWDTDAYGDELLYYLLGWPEGLRIVVEQCGDSVLYQRQLLLLECGLRWSGKICMSSNLEYCSRECTCAEAVKQILEAERSYPLHLREHEHWVLAMCSASVKARCLAIDDLKRRRQELKELGLLHLSSKQIDRMELRKSKVLDYYTGEVLKALKAVGVFVPPRLETEIKALGETGDFLVVHMGYHAHDFGLGGPLSSKAASVYHILGASPNTGDKPSVRALASSLYSEGFNDIDIADCAGVTPLAGKYLVLQGNVLSGPGNVRWNWGTSIESWLIEHGASLETQIPHRVAGYTTSHHVFTWIGLRSGFTKESSPFQLIQSSWDSKGGFTQQSLDTCRCKCSIGGCNPYNTMWKMLLRRAHRGRRKVPSLDRRSSRPFRIGDRSDSRHDNRQRLMSVVLEQTLLLEEACELPRAVKSICLRACTFEMLPLRHTCCDEGFPTCEDEEIREIWEEDQADIGRLEILMDEFEKKLEEMDCALVEFYQAYWIDRMIEVLRQMDEQILTATEIEDVERLGVKLTVEMEASGCEETEIEDKTSLEYWVQKMDDVAE